jgi:hypothetical protein
MTVHLAVREPRFSANSDLPERNFSAEEENNRQICRAQRQTRALPQNVYRRPAMSWHAARSGIAARR